jgi:deoxyribodipyrimidine photolyase-related protein
MGDQLNRHIGALGRCKPGEARILLVESHRMIAGRDYHRQRLHLVMAAMRRFAAELAKAGFTVDHRRADSLRAGFEAHVAEYAPDVVRATEPNARSTDALLRTLGVELVRSDQFLCHRDDFAAWAGDAKRLTMEHFYRRQRRALGYLMDGEEPAGGRWNFDHDNREPPPKDGSAWPDAMASELDDLDREVLDALPDTAIGSPPDGTWATSRRAALTRLRHFVRKVLPGFGPHEDAMMAGHWHLAHSLLSPYLNLGLLLPGEVCDAVESAYRNGDVAINSAEGFIRQVIGWREYMWGLYWLWPELEEANRLDHQRELPPAWTGRAATEMNCLAATLESLDEHAYVHHIQRLMILSNFANLYGIAPVRVRTWMRERYIDGGDWVMVPNVMGMGLWADGGRMATKPYVSGGAYVNRMSDYCKPCRFDPAKRTGDRACPFTTLYWDFLDRHRDRLSGNHRVARQYATLDRLEDLEAIRKRAKQVVAMIRDGKL